MRRRPLTISASDVSFKAFKRRDRAREARELKAQSGHDHDSRGNKHRRAGVFMAFATSALLFLRRYRWRIRRVSESFLLMCSRRASWRLLASFTSRQADEHLQLVNKVVFLYRRRLVACRSALDDSKEPQRRPGLDLRGGGLDAHSRRADPDQAGWTLRALKYGLCMMD